MKILRSRFVRARRMRPCLGRAGDGIQRTTSRSISSTDRASTEPVGSRRPSNPFVHVAIDDLNDSLPKPARKWAFNPMTAPPVTCFYVWASTLARAPNGENQFYTAERLYDIYRFNLSKPEDHEAVRGMAIRAFTAILDYFPNDYNRTADGKLEFDYASVALQRIQTLAPGEPLPQGWYLVMDSQGNLRATRI